MTATYDRTLASEAQVLMTNIQMQWQECRRAASTGDEVAAIDARYERVYKTACSRWLRRTTGPTA
jgi:hypothetical protein